MECLSISYKSAPLAMRQNFSFTEEKRREFMERAGALTEGGQCVLLNTCNRTEVYVQGENNLFGKIEAILAELADVTAEDVRQIDRRYCGNAAAGHLFKVACGMESMVLGEDEILGQVRNAYETAKENGYTGYELNTIFQAALTCAKKIKTETLVSKTSVSVATLAANEVFRLPGEEKTVLLIGSSGQIGGIILKNLLSRENIRVIATTRTHRGLYQDSTGRVENVDYADRYAYLDRADVVISATKSPHYTITAQKAAEAMKDSKERLFLDVAVPADIDEQIGEMENCRLITIDDFQALAKQNNEKKQQALEMAGKIVEEELDTLFKVLLFHESSGKISGWKEKYGKLPFEKLLFKFRDELDSSSFAEVLRVLDIE